MRKLLLATTAAAFVASAGSAFAQDSDTSNLTVSATTQEAISVNCATGLSFGTIAIPNSNAASTVTVDGSGTSSTGDAAIVQNGTVGSCSVSGVDQGGATYTLSEGPTGVLLANGSDTLSADLTLTPASGSVVDGTIEITGVLDIPLDTFVEGTGQAHGGYTKTVQLTVVDE